MVGSAAFYGAMADSNLRYPPIKPKKKKPNKIKIKNKRT